MAIKKFTANCDFGGQFMPVTLYLGEPAKGSHPLGFQNKWLGDNRGGRVPQEIMDSFQKLLEIAEKNNVPFGDLCEHVIKEIKANEELVNDAKEATALANPQDKKS